jgi:hypothetical protein
MSKGNLEIIKKNRMRKKNKKTRLKRKQEINLKLGAGGTEERMSITKIKYLINERINRRS